MRQAGKRRWCSFVFRIIPIKHLSYEAGRPFASRTAVVLEHTLHIRWQTASLKAVGEVIRNKQCRGRKLVGHDAATATAVLCANGDVCSRVSLSSQSVQREAAEKVACLLHRVAAVGGEWPGR